jgi:hypothetical protein
MEPLILRLGEGPFFTLVAGVTSILGILAIGVIRHKGMVWRLRRESGRLGVINESTRQRVLEEGNKLENRNEAHNVEKV